MKHADPKIKLEVIIEQCEKQLKGIVENAHLHTLKETLASLRTYQTLVLCIDDELYEAGERWYQYFKALYDEQFDAAMENTDNRAWLGINDFKTKDRSIDPNTLYPTCVIPKER